MKYTSATPYIASFVILRKGKKVAFVLRSNTKWMNGYYSLPSGKVENNESFTAAALREVAEEAGVNIKSQDLTQVMTVHRCEPSSYGSDWVDIYFEATKWSGKAYNAEPHIHGELSWFEFDSLPENVVPSVRFALEQLAVGKHYCEYGWE